MLVGVGGVNADVVAHPIVDVNLPLSTLIVPTMIVSNDFFEFAGKYFFSKNYFYIVVIFCKLFD